MTPPGAVAAAERAGQRLPVVLVHGYLGGAAQWREQVTFLSGRFRVITIDLPGFGHATHQPALGSIGAFAQHVIATLYALEVERFILLGHSMGGMIAQDVARRIPAQVDRLVLYGTGPLGRMPDRFEPLEVSISRLEDDGLPRTAHRIVATWFIDGDRHPGFEMLRRLGVTASPEAARAALSAMSGWDGRAHLSALQMPVLILWGDHDRSYRWPQVETLWREIPNAMLGVVPGASHAAHVEKPHLFNALLADFFTP